MRIVFVKFVFSILICTVYAAPQYQEVNDQFEELNHTELQEPNTQKQAEAQHTDVQKHTEVEHTEIDTNTLHDDTKTETTQTFDPIQRTSLKELTLDDISNFTAPQPSFITRTYKIITGPIIKFITAPKVSTVITNIGTCIVNGAMEIISFYFPAPLIPLIASAAGLVIPFEPVVMLREKIPVTSYRRAFKTAMKGFMGTFDRYKYDEEDPYMTRRFNRRFMDNSNEEKMGKNEAVIKPQVWQSPQYENK